MTIEDDLATVRDMWWRGHIERKRAAALRLADEIDRLNAELDLSGSVEHQATLRAGRVHSDYLRVCEAYKVLDADLAAAHAEMESLVAELNRPMQHMVCDTKIQHEIEMREKAEAELRLEVENWPTKVDLVGDLYLMTAERDAARAELDAMLPVVDAACAWVERASDDPTPWADFEDLTLLAAVDTYRAGGAQ